MFYLLQKDILDLFDEDEEIDVAEKEDSDEFEVDEEL